MRAETQKDLKEQEEGQKKLSEYLATGSSGYSKLIFLLSLILKNKAPFILPVLLVLN